MGTTKGKRNLKELHFGDFFSSVDPIPMENQITVNLKLRTTNRYANRYNKSILGYVTKIWLPNVSRVHNVSSVFDISFILSARCGMLQSLYRQ